MALTKFLVSQLTLLESKQVFDMVPNKKGLQVIMKNTSVDSWENRIFTLTGEEPKNDGWGHIYYSTVEHENPVNMYFMVPLNSLKLLILNKREKEN